MNTSKKINYSKKFSKILFTGIFAFSFVFTLANFAPQAAAVKPPQDNAYTVVFNDRTVNEQNNTSTWSYTVHKAGEGPNLSHWIWQPCFSEEELNERFVSAMPEADEVGFEGSTRHYGVKWEIEGEFPSGPPGLTFTVTITEQPEMDEDGATAVIKAGQAGDHDHGNQPHFDLTIPGPSCAEPPPPPERYCGDGNLNQGEECDEGEDNGAECSAEYNSSCNYCSNECEIIELTGPYCGDGNLDQSEQCDDGNNVNGDGCSATCTIEQEEPEEGIQPDDIVVNEIMQNPDAVSDSYGEWFELYNSTDREINLEGCIIRDNDTNNHIINSSLIISANNYLVLVRNGDPAQNGGVNADYVYANFILANDADEIILECNGVEIDRVEYDGGPEFPDPTGSSMILANPAWDNNIGSNWCVSTSFFGMGDFGTPGAQNDDCGFCTDIDQDGYSLEGGNCGPVDCNDTNSNINPGATEICDNQIDDDCDGYTDSNDSNCQPTPTPECEPEEQRVCSAGQSGICAAGTQTCSEQGVWGQCIQNTQPNTENCTNSLDDDCDGYVDGDDPDCQPGPTPGAITGGPGPTPLTIFNEKSVEVSTDSATVTWFTSTLATSRVIYDTVSHPTLGDPPNYGYAFSTNEDSNKVTFHRVAITGLTPATTYFWRAVSRSSPEIVGEEMSFTTQSVPEEVVEEEMAEEISLEKIAETLEEIRERTEILREEIEEMIPPQVLPAEVPEVEAGPGEIEEEIVEEEEEIEEEFEEELGEELIKELAQEQEPKMGLERFLAAVGGIISNLKNLFVNIGWILLLIIVLWIVYLFLSKIRSRKII